MTESPRRPLSRAELASWKLAVEAQAAEIAEQCAEDGASLETILTLLNHEIATSHALHMRAAAKAQDFYDFARPEPADAGVHAVGWRCTHEAVRCGGLAIRAQDRIVRAALALRRLYGAGSGGDGGDKRRFPSSGIGQGDPAPKPIPKPGKPANDDDPPIVRETPAKPQARSGDPHPEPVEGRGRLRHGNPAGDYMAAPRCGAATRAHARCRQPAMANGRCRFHGGKSTGPRTPEGLRRSRAARLVHGGRTAEIIDLRSASARSARRMKSLLAAASLAGHGVHRSVSSAPLDAVALNHRGTEARRERANENDVATSGATANSRTAYGRATTHVAPGITGIARRSRSLCVSVPLWFKAAGLEPNRIALAGHGVHRSVSSAPLESVALNHRDTEARRERVNEPARAAPQPTHDPRAAAGRATTHGAPVASIAPESRSLCVSVPLWFKAAGLEPNRIALAGHGVHRSVSSPLDAAGMDREDAKTQRNPLKEITPRQPDNNAIARPQAAPGSGPASAPAEMAPFTRSLRAFASSRSNPSPAAAGDGLDRSGDRLIHAEARRRGSRAIHELPLLRCLRGSAWINRSLCVSVPLWFKARDSLAGHEVHRSVSPARLRRAA